MNIIQAIRTLLSMNQLAIYGLAWALCFAPQAALAQNRIPTQPATPLAEAQAALERRDWAMAERVLEPLIKVESKNPFVYFELAQLYEHTNRTQAARNIYQAIAAIPASEKGNYLAMVLRDGKRQTILLADLATEKLASLMATDAGNSTPTPSASSARPPALAATSATLPSPPSAIATATQNIENTPPVIAMRQWIQAWQSKNLEAYITSYMPGYKGDMNDSAAWQKNRTQRIQTKNKIAINVYDIQFKQLSDKEVQLDFSQAYVADKLTNLAQKTLIMVNNGGRWLIMKETIK